MKFTSTSTIVLGLFLALPAGATNNPDSKPKRISGVELARPGKHSNLPSFLRFEKGKEIDFNSWQSWIGENLKLGNGHSFVLRSTENDQLGEVHYRYLQSYNGHVYENAMWIVHTRAGKVYAMNGLLYNTPTSTTAALSESDALNKALAHVGAQEYKWQMPGEEAHLKAQSHDPKATYYPQGTLVFASPSRNYAQQNLHLCWKFNIYAQKPLSRSEIFVDAQTGEVIDTKQILHDADATGTAVTAYSGTKTIVTDNFAGGYRLHEADRGNGIFTYNMQTGTSYAAAIDFTDADNYWNNVNAAHDEVATDAHWGAEMTYDYYMVKHSRNSIDGAGFALHSYVHYDVGYANAFWDGTQMNYGDGDGTMGPLTAIDIAGHEISHGLTSFTANLDYADESGALNESFSDIFGTSIEWYANPSAADWLIGEDIGVVIRNMSDPNSVGDPDTYFGTNWAPLGGPDNGGVHTNSNVQNYWYYLLSVGGSGTNDNGDSYSVSGIGIDHAGDIAFRNLTVYLTSTSDFSDSRFYAIQSAIDLFGGCTPEVQATTDAWYAVGVGPAYVAAVVSNFTADVTTACTSPFTANFTNTSINGIGFTWNFGDGGTSTANNPSHTYATNGTYDVQLIVDGGACGSDTLLMPGYITVDNTLPCNVNLPTSGSAATQTACSGTLYDSGGPSGDYGANEDAQVTISPLGALTVDLDFTAFDVEPGTGTSCNYDKVTVYDGPSTASPVIGVYCNNNIPTTLSSTGSSITIVFHSDPGLELAGFAMGWSCNLSSIAPTANFNADVDTTCNGTVNFTDMSSNGPAAWSWDFGDGGTSSLQNPAHTYTTNGVYTVTLVASNSIGSNTYTRTDYIYVELPDAPSVTAPGIVCSGDITSIDATSTSGTVTWYNVATGGVPLATGSPFVTPPLTTGTTYYVASEITNPSLYVGPLTNGIGGGGYFVGDQYEIFTAYQAVVLKSVQVYANGAGNRTIELRNSSGTVIQSAVVNIPNGSSRINLNFNIPVGTNLQLGTLAGSSPNLYRNNSGAVYPYNLAGKVSITNSSAGTAGYYYFFYDWEIQDPACSSTRVPVNVFVQPCTGIAEVSSTLDVAVVPNPATSQAKISINGANGKVAAIDVRNSLGQLVWSEKAALDGSPVILNAGNFGRGVYLVNVIVDNQRIVKKLVVE